MKADQHCRICTLAVICLFLSFAAVRLAKGRAIDDSVQEADRAVSAFTANEWSSADTEALLARALARSSKAGLEALAAADDPRAETLVGTGMVQGDFGFVHDELAGAQLLSRAVKAGFPPAAVMLGWLFQDGFGRIPRDEQRAVGLYRMAADKGDAGGEECLADMYVNGRGGLPKNPTMAIKLYEDAARQGNKRAEEKLKKLENET